jgi:hypothetical protein
MGFVNVSSELQNKKFTLNGIDHWTLNTHVGYADLLRLIGVDVSRSFVVTYFAELDSGTSISGTLGQGHYVRLVDNMRFSAVDTPWA